MNNKQFYDELTKRVKNHLGTLRDLHAEMKATEAKSKDTKYSEGYRKQHADKAWKLRQDIARALKTAENDVAALNRQFADELRGLDALDPAQLTDDARLLTSGLPLTEKDYRAILQRSEGNRTMQQLTLRSAKEKGIDLGVVYVPSSRAAQDVEGTLYTSQLVLKRYAYPDSAYFDKLIGPGSQLHQVFSDE